MSQPTTIHLQHQPAFRLGAPSRSAVNAVASAAAWLFVAVVVALSMAAVIATAGDRPAGFPSRLDPPALVVRDAPAATPAAGSVTIEAEPAPTPEPGF